MSTRAQRRAVYGSRRWRALRLQVLEAAGWLCQCPDCTRDGLTMGAELVHHIEPWDATGLTKIERLARAFDRKNLLAVSRRCHAAIHAADKPQAAQEWAAFTAELIGEVAPC